MDVSVPILTGGPCGNMLYWVEALVPHLQAHAAALDVGSLFPAEDIAALRDFGLLRAVCPRRFGGLGVGTESAAALPSLSILRALGRGNLSVGRLIEAHMNALKLVCAYGDAAAVEAACADAGAGHLFGLWVTGDTLRLESGVLRGGKDICSGAGFVTRALVTVEIGADAPVMMVADVAQARVAGPYVALHGMRAACNAAMDLDGLAAGITIGQPGDYLRQPLFSAGAWRTSAVTLGGMDSLVDVVTAALLKRGRADDPHQQARVGQMKIAQQTAYLWMRQAAPLAERTGEPDAIAAFVNLARIAVEQAGLNIIRIAQQSLGLSCMVERNSAERIMRDLATYLRQPAGDQTLTEAAGYFTRHSLPAL